MSLFTRLKFHANYYLKILKQNPHLKVNKTQLAQPDKGRVISCIRPKYLPWICLLKVAIERHTSCHLMACGHAFKASMGEKKGEKKSVGILNADSVQLC